MSEWTEGSWNGDWPVEPKGWDAVWYMVDGKRSRLDVCPISVLSLCLRTALVYRQTEEPDSPPPRWWWMGIDYPMTLPPESSRGIHQVEMDRKYAEEHCTTHDLLLPCEWCLDPDEEPAQPCGDCGYCVPCQSDPMKAYCKRHGLLGKTGDCQDCRDEENYCP